jgi:hypothetical protein
MVGHLAKAGGPQNRFFAPDGAALSGFAALDYFRKAVVIIAQRFNAGVS